MRGTTSVQASSDVVKRVEESSKCPCSGTRFVEATVVARWIWALGSPRQSSEGRDTRLGTSKSPRRTLWSLRDRPAHSDSCQRFSGVLSLGLAVFVCGDLLLHHVNVMFL